LLAATVVILVALDVTGLVAFHIEKAKN